MTFDVFEEFATDEALEENGTWFELGKGAALLIARSGNRAYGKALAKAVEKNRVALDFEDEAADKLSDEIMVDVLARTILLGFRNLSFQGKPAEYSLEKAKEMLAVKDFRKRVIAYSDNFEAYKVKQEAKQGNV